MSGTTRRRVAPAFRTRVIQDILDKRVVGGFVYVAMIDMSQTGFDVIHLEVREGNLGMI